MHPTSEKKFKVIRWRHVVGCEGMWQGVGACDRGGGRVWGHVAVAGYVVEDQAYDMDGDMWSGLGHVAGRGGMWQGVGECGRDGGRVWGHVAGVCGRGSGLWHGSGHVAGVGTYGRV